jgi:hypothetical protein
MEVAQEQQADLIVVGVRLTRPQRFLLGKRIEQARPPRSLRRDDRARSVGGTRMPSCGA